MAWNPLAGKTGFVTIGGVQMTFGKWSSNISSDLVKTHNFTGGGFKSWIGGLTGATFKLTMNAYDAGNVGLTVGNSYAFVFGYTTLITLAVTAVVKELAPSVDVEGAQTLEVTVESTGTFTPTVA